MPQAAGRGIGRYVQRQVAAAAGSDPNNEFLILLPRAAKKRLILPELRKSPNVRVCRVPRRVEKQLKSPSALPDWIETLNVDVFHATCPAFAISRPAWTADPSIPMVVTHYDLIPWHHRPADPTEADLDYFERYDRRLDMVRKAHRVLTISQHAASDAVNTLALDPSKIVLAYPCAEKVFSPLSPLHSTKLLKRLRRRGLPDHYGVTVSLPNESKNLENLLEALALWPAEQGRLPLAVVSNLSVEETMTLDRIVSRLDLHEWVFTTGHVTDRELAALYSSAELMIYPSRYEGFGLPVLEALSCNCPVVASNATSIPEIVGDLGPLFDPEDPVTMAQTIAEAYSDRLQLRTRLTRQLSELNEKFSEDALGEAALTAYRGASESNIAAH